MKIITTVQKLSVLVILSLFMSVYSIGQINSLDYQLRYNDVDDVYECYIVINEGDAMTANERMQFGAQYSIVIPTGTDLIISERFMPLLDNTDYSGTTPMEWIISTIAVSPASHPERNFVAISPTLSPNSHYNNIAEGDTIKLFNFVVDGMTACSPEILIFDDWDGYFGGGNFLNGFTIGGYSQLYDSILPAINIPIRRLSPPPNVYFSGPHSIFVGDTTTVAVDSSSAGTWTSSDTSIVIVDDNGKVTGLSIGVAELIFFDDFGCNSNSLEIEILDPYCITPDMLVTSLSSNTASDGSITCSPTGGASPYTYLWSNGGTTKTISDLSSGTYFVTVNGSRGCIGYDTAIVAFCPYNMAVISTDSISCYSICDGVISTEVTGGVEPYNYVWSTDQTSSQLIGLCVGDYAVTITDSIGCEIYKSGITIAQPNLLLVNAEANTTSAIAIPSGGTSPYSYTWSNGETTASILDLVLGYYTITVTDANGCASVETVITDIGFSIDSLFDIREEHLGAIYIRTNKNANSTFSWVGPNGFSSDLEDIKDLEDGGCYTVTMTDSNLQISKDTTICINDRTATSDIYDTKNQILAYPNPSSGIWVLDFQEIVTSQMSLSIFDISGRLEDVVSMKVNDDGKASVDMSRFENGVYYLKIDYDSGTDFKKIIIVK